MNLRILNSLMAGLAGGLLLAQAGRAETNTPAPTETLTEAVLAPLLTEALRERTEARGDLELRFTRPLEGVRAPAGATLRIVDMPSFGISPSFIVKFELTTTNGVAGAWQAVVQARLWREVWVTRSLLPRGAALSADDLVLERRDVLACREPLAGRDLDFAELETACQVGPATPLPARALKQKTLVRRGQIISALLEDGALAITLKVEASEDGARGQLIKVRNPVSRRDLRAVVLNDSSVKITI